MRARNTIILGSAGIPVYAGKAAPEAPAPAPPPPAEPPVSSPPVGAPLWRQNMPARTWKLIGNPMASVDPRGNPALNPNYPAAPPWQGASGFVDITTAWSGGAFNRSNNALEIFGGGHEGYAGNERPRIRLMVDNPQWELHVPPSGSLATGYQLPGQGGPNPYDSHYALDRDTYPDGRLRSIHSYNNLVWANNNLYCLPSAIYATGHLGFNLWRVTGAEGKDWTSMGPHYAANSQAIDVHGGLCHDTKRNWLIAWDSYNTTVRYYDIAGNVWGDTGKVQYNNSDRTRPIYIPELDIVVCIGSYYKSGAGEGGTAGFRVYDYNRENPNGWWTYMPAFTGTPDYAACDAATGEWVPSLGGIVTWGGGTSLGLLKPPAGALPTNNLAVTGTWAWSRIDAHSSNTVTPANPTGNYGSGNTSGTYGRFFYSPDLDGVGVVVSVNGDPGRIAFFAFN